MFTPKSQQRSQQNLGTVKVCVFLNFSHRALTPTNTVNISLPWFPNSTIWWSGSQDCTEGVSITCDVPGTNSSALAFAGYGTGQNEVGVNLAMMYPSISFLNEMNSFGTGKGWSMRMFFSQQLLQPWRGPLPLIALCFSFWKVTIFAALYTKESIIS